MKNNKTIIKRAWKVAILLVAVAGGCIVIYRSRAEPEKSRALNAEYIIVPSYTGQAFSAVEPQDVDDIYMDDLMDRMLEVYNEIRETNYPVWTDEQVAYTTQGKYTTASEWRDYLQKKYIEIEKQNARNDTAQMILSQIVSEATLLGYDQEDYEAAKKEVEQQIIFGNGFSEKEELLQTQQWSEEEYQNNIEETALELLKQTYVIRAIAEAEGLEPTEAEAAEAGIEDGKEKEEWFRTEMMNRVKDFLYNNNSIK